MKKCKKVSHLYVTACQHIKIVVHLTTSTHDESHPDHARDAEVDDVNDVDRDRLLQNPYLRGIGARVLLHTWPW